MGKAGVRPPYGVAYPVNELGDVCFHWARGLKRGKIGHGEVARKRAIGVLQRIRRMSATRPHIAEWYEKMMFVREVGGKVEKLDKPVGATETARKRVVTMRIGLNGILYSDPID